jgi:hypothetical protein
MKEFSEEFLRKNWGSGEHFNHKGKSYRVGRMNDKRYFLEPHKKNEAERSERLKHKSGTKWLEKHPKKNNSYIIDKVLSKYSK